jgi:signal transduction histidine kinase
MVDQWKKIEKYAYLGIAVSLIILVAISSISYQSLIQIQNDFNWVTSTRDVLLNLSYFFSSLKDAEMGQRGFLLTGQERYLEPYKYVEKGVKSHFESLRIIAADNIAQQTRIDMCEKLVTKKLQELQKLITLQKDKGPEAAKDMILTGTGKQIMEEIQALVQEMDKEERALLDQRSKSIAVRIKLDAAVKTAAIIILLISAILIISRISYLFRIYKKAMAKQMELVDMKSDFVSNVSHELRTPLKAIRESISIVLDESAGHVNDEQKKFLTVSKRNVDRLAKLINDVLDFQKLGAGKTKLDARNNNMNEVVKEVYELMLQPAKKKGLSFTMKPDSQLPKIKFDRDKIIQVLTNIVNNAIKFTEKGAVTITTSMEGNALYVSVQDAGPGIAEKDLSKIFNRFEQASRAKHKKVNGVGLGLAISKDIIRLHKGKIRAESEFGKGATVWFSLPIIERRKC